MAEPNPPHDQAAGRFVVLTGGPGSGKTTLINALHRLGFATSAETGRAIIQEQVAIGGRALPWLDPGLFIEMILSWEMRSYRIAAQSTGPVFFDRGVPDVIGGYALLGLPVPAHVRAATAAFRYQPVTFFAPPWPQIYRPDTERKQTFAEAERTYEAMAAAYQQSGYQLVTLPRVPGEQRLRFVLKVTGLSAAGKKC